MKNVIGTECRFAIHIPTKHPDIPDLHLIKEQIHYSNGEIKPNLRFIKDFKRSVYITKPNKRNHEQKKEFEYKDNLLEKQVTQSNLRFEIARLLNKQWSKDSIKQLCSSPYIYGSDISSTAIIKNMYKERYPDLLTPFSIATFDIETDVLYGTNKAIMATVIFKDKIFTAVLKEFVTGFSNIQDLFNNKLTKYIGEYIEKRKMTAELYIADDLTDLIRTSFNKIHEWKPDFLVIWNMDFDIPQILRMLEELNIDPKDVFCDPSIPKEYRICKYKQGPKKKVTSSGVVKPINPAAQWHTLICTSSFYVIDAMCSYKHIRLSQQEEPSYSLDSILNKELGIRKLKFEEANNYSGLKWHQVMQTKYQIEYIIYNIFDCLSMIELDEKTKDLSFTLPSMSGISDFSDFRSQPKRIVDALHFDFLKDNVVIATAGKVIDDIKEENSEDDNIELDIEEKDDILGLDGWIVTLPSHLSVYGLPCLLEDENILSFIRAFCFDSDAVSAYPTCTSVANVSKETTKKEIIDIIGIDEEVFRKQNLNCILGPCNALEYSTVMFNLPKPTELLELID